jgi:hypothetical protein
VAVAVSVWALLGGYAVVAGALMLGVAKNRIGLMA